MKEASDISTYRSSLLRLIRTGNGSAGTGGVEPGQNALETWREKVFQTVAMVCFLLAFITGLPLLMVSFLDGEYLTVSVTAMAAVFFTAFVLHPRIPFSLRAWCGLLLLYAVGVYSLQTGGMAGNGRTWLYFFAVMTCLTMGARPAALALLLNTGTIVYAIASTFSDKPQLAGLEHAGLAAAGGGVFILVCILSVVSIVLLIESLESDLVQANRYRGELEDTRLELDRLKQNLETEAHQRTSVEKSLQESERQLRALMETPKEFALFRFVYNDNAPEKYGLQFASPSVRTILGVEGVTDTETWWSTVLATDLPKARASVRKSLSSGRLNETIRIHHALSGEIRWVQIVASIVKGKDGQFQYATGLLMDVTEYKQAEIDRANLMGQLRQAHQMETLGVIAGGVAHDFNNILGAVIGHSEVAAAALPDDSPARHSMNQIIHACNRGKTLVRQILKFSGKFESGAETVLPGPIIRETLALLQSSLPSTIKIDVDVSGSSAPVLADPARINQMILILASNAAQRLKERGGTLAVKMEDIYLPEANSRSHIDFAPGVYVKIKVASHPQGGWTASAGRRFAGMENIGALVVEELLEGMGGRVEGRPAPGSGLPEAIYLPAVSGQASAAAERVSAPVSADVSGKERVLYVDDEEALVDVSMKMLKLYGYNVTSHTSSIKAWDDFQNDPERFDIVITDQTMPELSGDELARRIKAARPNLPVILCTGYSESMDEDKARTIGIDAFLLKPVTSRELAGTVRRILDDIEPPSPAE